MEEVIYESNIEEYKKCQEDYKHILTGVVIGGWNQAVAGHRWHTKKCLKPEQ